jgi:hypothetical protein
MAHTAVAKPLNVKRPFDGQDKRHYSFYKRDYFYFTLAFVVIMAGFWPSFFKRLGATDASHMIHGISATLWTTVPIIQAWLIGRRHFVLHRRFGRVAILLVPIVVVSGLHMVQIMILDDPGIAQPLRSKLVFLDTSAMLFFAFVFSLALKNIYLRHIKAHAQYMACTVLIVLEPGLERFLVLWAPGIHNFTVALNVALVIMEIIVATLIYIEWRSDRVRPPYVMTLAFFVIVHVLLGPLSVSPTFRSLAHWFGTL